MPEEKEKGSMGKIINICITLAVLGGLGYFIYLKMSGPSDDPVLKEQLDPNTALKVYLETASDFVHGKYDFYKLEKTILKEDHKWFSENYNNFFHDTFNLKGGIDPAQGEAMAKITVMTRLLEIGAFRADCQIKKSEVNGDIAKITVWQYAEGGGREVIPVELKKEGKYWKVKDFAGGKSYAESGKIAHWGYISEKALARDGDNAVPAESRYKSEEMDEEAEKNPQPKADATANSHPENKQSGSGQAAPAQTQAASQDEFGFGGESAGDAQADSQPQPKPDKQEPPQPQPQSPQPVAQPNPPDALAAQNGTEPVPQPQTQAQPQTQGQQTGQSAQPQQNNGNFKLDFSNITGNQNNQQQIIAQADALIKEANNAWNSGKVNNAIVKAQQAYDLCKSNLGENHPKTQEIKKMLDIAKAPKK